MSVFDRFHKLKSPSAKFAWKYTPAGYKVNPQSVVCEGELEELDPITSATRSTKYYAATTRDLFCFGVTYG